MLPLNFKPMLATMAEPFNSQEFTYEIKWDGYRCLAFLDSTTRLQSRNLKNITASFPELGNIHHQFRHSGCLVDGEVIALRNGKPSFSELQKRAQLKNPDHIQAVMKTIPVIYIIFDLLYLNHLPIYEKPLAERRQLLRENTIEGDQLILASFIEEKGIEYFSSIAKMGMEGVIAKKKVSLYLPGKRGKQWLKFKQKKSSNFIICGFIMKSTSRGDLSSLILGAYVNGKLKPFGFVGTGFSIAELKAILEELKKIQIDRSPFTHAEFQDQHVVWTSPIIVCEIEYLELTDEGHLRHPGFKKFRPDIKASDCEFEG